MAVEQMVVAKLRSLPQEQQQEVLAFVTTIGQTVPKPPCTSAHGLWAHYGDDIGEDDIAEARAELWNGFPRANY